jgi:hypothetical protein
MDSSPSVQTPAKRKWEPSALPGEPLKVQLFLRDKETGECDFCGGVLLVVTVLNGAR